MMDEAPFLNAFSLEPPVDDENDPGEDVNYKGWLPLDDEPEVEEEDLGTVTMDEFLNLGERLLEEKKKRKKKKKKKRKKRRYRKKSTSWYIGGPYGIGDFFGGGDAGGDGGGGE